MAITDKLLLQKAEWQIAMCGPDHIIASIFEHPDNTVWHEKIWLSDLPNELISHDYLVRFGIDVELIRSRPR